MPASGAPMVFISYRRDDSGGHVGRLYDALSAHFGRQRLFFDIDHIAPGQDFVQVLENSLSRSSVLLVVMGKRWAGSGRIGARRIDDSGDFVRLEVARGLARPELRVIPVLIQGAKMPGPAALPEELKDLSRRNAIELSDLRWREDVARLIASLETSMRGEAAPSAATVSQLLSKMKVPAGAALPQWWRWAGMAAAVLAVAWAAIGAFRSEPSGAPEPVTTGTVSNLDEVPKGDPPKVPERLDRTVRGVLPAARKWRGDAVLTEIEAQLADTGREAGTYRVSYQFRSPADGAGLTVMTTASGDASYRTLPPVAKKGTRAMPDSFIDLAKALAAAREAGMFGQLRSARLTLATGASRAGRPTWTLKPTETSGSKTYYIDGFTGEPVAAPPARKKGGLIGAVEGIFK
jgi:TIR domain